VLLGIVGRLEVLNYQRNRELSAELADKVLISVGLFTAQVEVAMDGKTIIAEAEQDVKQGYGIGSSTESDKHFIAFVEEFMLLYVGFYSAQHEIWESVKC